MLDLLTQLAFAFAILWGVAGFICTVEDSSLSGEDRLVRALLYPIPALLIWTILG